MIWKPTEKMSRGSRLAYSFPPASVLQRTNREWCTPLAVRKPFFVWKRTVQSVNVNPHEPLSGSPSTMPPSRMKPSRV